MGVTFHQYLEDHGLLLLIAADADFLPGLIVERDNGGFWPFDDIRNLLGDERLTYKTRMVEADMPDVISGRKKVGAGGGIELPPFLTIRGGLKSSRYVNVRIGEVRTRCFGEPRLRLWNQLRRMLRKSRRRHPDLWEGLKKKHYCVLSTWYTSKYTVDLGNALPVELDVEFEREIAVRAGTSLDIDREAKVISVTGTRNVPFAFHGERMKF
jgi:hypothetical protein